jgi:plastocyanin
MWKRRLLPLALVAVLAACQMAAPGPSNSSSSGTGTGSGSMGPTTGTTPSMTIHGDQFMPQMDTVTAGTTVTWTNSDGVAHTVTSNPGDATSFDSGNINPAGTFSFTFTTAGTFPYSCTIHSFMTGTITVTP